MPLPPVPAIPGVDAYLRADGDGAVLQVPRRDFVFQGALVALLVPVLCVLLGFLALGADDQLGPVLAAGVACGGGALGLLAGVGMIAMSGRSSERTRTRVLADGAFVLADGRVVEKRSIAKLRVGQPNAMMKWVGVIATSDGGDVVLLGRVPPSRGTELAAVAGWVGDVCGVPVDASVASSGLGLAPNKAAAYCYVPVYGMWLVMSIWALIAAKDPGVRFAAKQSLAFYLSTTAALIGAIVVLVPVSIALDGSPLQAVALVVTIGVVLVLALGRLVVGGYAGYRAWKGDRWVIPGFGWLAGELPADVGGPAPAGVWKPPGP